MQLQKRIKKVESINSQNLSGWLQILSDDELTAKHDEIAALYPTQSKALDKVMETLSINELEALRDGKESLVSRDKLMRLKDAGKIKN